MIAAVRNPSHAGIETLTRFAIGPSSTLVILEINDTVHFYAATAICLLQSEHDITHVNNVIANTGISNMGPYGSVAGVRIKNVEAHLNVHVIGTLAYSRPCCYCPSKRAQAGKSATLSSILGDIEATKQRLYHNAVYGASEAEPTYLIYFEDGYYVTLVVDPRSVKQVCDLSSVTDHVIIGSNRHVQRRCQVLRHEEGYHLIKESVNGMWK